MSDISVSIPLAWLSGLKDFSPSTIQEHLENIGDSKQEVEQVKTQVAHHLGTMKSWNTALRQILDDSPDEFTKVRMLRGLLSDTDNYLKGYSE